MKNKVLFMASMALFGVTSLQAQLNVGSTSAPNASAVLQSTSITKGLLPPLMNETQRNAITSAAIGLIIFNTTANQLQPC